jgi:ANTAR domain
LTREARVVQSLVDLADTLVADYDVIDVLTGLAHRCVEVLEMSAAGVMLAAPGGDLRLVASSSEAMRVVELFELQAREGPCLDAFRTVEAGFGSVFALPLRLRATTIGALNLFTVEHVPPTEADVTVARAFADLATISVLQTRAVDEVRLVSDQLTRALTSRIVIEQAKGVVFERAGIEMDAAFTRMRMYARDHNRLLTDVARAAIDGTLDTSAWASPPMSPRT